MARARTQVDVIEYERPWVYPKQGAFLFNDKRYSVVEASSKSGKTSGCLFWINERACLNGDVGRNYWWVAPWRKQAAIAYTRYKNYTRHLAHLLRFNDSQLTIRIPNGAILWFLSGENPDSLFGDDVYDVVLDEASRMREEAWYAVRTTLTATGGSARIIGNVKGTKNWFYRLARRAEGGEPDHYYAKLTAHDAIDAGIFPVSEMEDARRNLPESVFNELYLAIPTEDGSNPFGIAAIKAVTVPLLSAKPPAVWGIDVARKVDWTWCIALDEDGRMCRSLRWQAPWPETITRIAALVGQTEALIDDTGVGDPVTQQVQLLVDNLEGYTFTPKSKQQLMEGLAIAIQQSEVTIADDPILLGELNSFEYEATRTGVRYASPEGMHDDGVCALALAWKHYTTQILHAPQGTVSDFSPF